MARGQHVCRPSPCARCQVAYARLEVEGLLTALFNGGTLPNDTQPDPQMPRAKANPSRLNGLAACLIDVGRGWQFAGVEAATREAVELYFGWGWTHGRIALEQGCSTSTARRRCERGVGAVLAVMNGQQFTDDGEGLDGDEG
jgi:hypothetical protein